MVQKKKGLKDRIKSRRYGLMRHILKYEELMETILEGIVDGRRGRGKKLEFTEQIVENAGCNKYLAMKSFA